MDYFNMSLLGPIELRPVAYVPSGGQVLRTVHRGKQMTTLNVIQGFFTRLSVWGGALRVWEG